VPCLAAALEQLVAGGEGVLEGGGVGLDAVRADGFLVDDEASVDRVVRLFQQGSSVGGVGGEDHAVGVVGQAATSVQDHVRVGVVGDAVGAGKVQAVDAGDAFDIEVGLVDVDGLGCVAFETEHDGLGGAVTVACRAEGAEEFRT